MGLALDYNAKTQLALGYGNSQSDSQGTCKHENFVYKRNGKNGRWNHFSRLTQASTAGRLSQQLRLYGIRSPPKEITRIIGFTSLVPDGELIR